MARKNTYRWEAWERDPKDSEKDTKLDSGELEAVSEEIVRQIAIGKLYAEHADAIANGKVEVNVRPF